MASSYSSQFPVLQKLLVGNSEWSSTVKQYQPKFFEESSKGQAPKVLWIGCADSREPETVITACKPGDIFVTRNIANQFHPDDDSILSVIAYAVEHVGVEHVVVCGHTSCGGCAAAWGSRAKEAPAKLTPLDRWLSVLINIARTKIAEGASEKEAVQQIAIENVKLQVDNICKSEVATKAWAAGKRLYIHGWLYQLENGQICDLEYCFGSEAKAGATPTHPQ